ncbi:hypothetical protein [Flavobacterium sp. 25HG05S-40]|uniref:hypothetical protein n=1 Tax=Flavobacterium sp. 25HG05S-40 TaxID=3458682 RepID=UPI004044E91A
MKNTVDKMKNTVEKMNRQELIEEYKLILQKKSQLSRAQRDLVESRIAKLHKAGSVTTEQLTINNNQI